MTNGPAAVLFDINGDPLATLGDGSLLVTIADGYVTLASIPDVSITNFPASQTVNGSVIVSGTATVSGTVAVSNLPATQAVSGTVAVSSLPAISGTVSVSNLPATQVVSGAVTVGNLPATQAVSQSGLWTVTPNRSSTSTVVAVAPSVSNVVLLAANANRVFAHVSNGNSKNLYIKLGASASLTSYTDVVLSGNSYDVPTQYIGIVSGVWGIAPNGGSALCTELLP
jgi:hypothetical protein